MDGSNRDKSHETLFRGGTTRRSVTFYQVWRYLDLKVLGDITRENLPKDISPLSGQENATKPS